MAKKTALKWQKKLFLVVFRHVFLMPVWFGEWPKT